MPIEAGPVGENAGGDPRFDPIRIPPTEVRVKASSMDSATLPERSQHVGDSRPQRRRRSAAQLPALVAPVDIPEDAEGRVEFLVVRAPADRDEPARDSATPPGGREDRVKDLLTAGSGWGAVVVLGVLLVAVFAILDAVFH